MQKNVLLLLTVGLVWCGLSRETAAQSLSFEIVGGAVTLRARDVTIDEILARWSEKTGLTVVSQNGHGSDIPVTMQISAVPEREALALVLRGLSGYIMGERRDPETGVVRIDRLVILPDSAAKIENVLPPAPLPAPGRGAAAFDEAAVPRELAPTVDHPVDER